MTYLYPNLNREAFRPFSAAAQKEMAPPASSGYVPHSLKTHVQGYVPPSLKSQVPGKCFLWGFVLDTFCNANVRQGN